MRKLTCSACLLIALFSATTYAVNIHPVVTLGWGSDTTDVNLSQNITLFAPFENYYYQHSTDTETIGSIFLGAELPFMNKWAWQLGAAYYQNITPFNPTGTVYQFADMDFGNLTYNFNVQSRRYILQTKLLYAVNEWFHPYITGGAGEAVNKSYSYTEIGVTSADVAMQATFANKTYHAFTYSLGLGFELVANEHIRFGFGYNYVNLGRAGLGTIPNQDSNQTLTLNNLNTNEFMMQLSYVG
ncbi:MAG: outer membrane beta-barrel protein [Pseudomonadota bacterium]